MWSSGLVEFLLVMSAVAVLSSLARAARPDHTPARVTRSTRLHPLLQRSRKTSKPYKLLG